MAIGMCHIKTVTKNKFEFIDEYSITNGYYMISSNGGSWSGL